MVAHNDDAGGHGQALDEIQGGGGGGGSEERPAFGEVDGAETDADLIDELDCEDGGAVEFEDVAGDVALEVADVE